MDDSESYHGQNSPAELSAEQIRRQQQWEKHADGLRLITDALGKPIDGGIFETVAALNVFDIHTTQSCEGHADRGTLSPWVQIQAPETEETIRLRDRVNKILETIESYEKQSKPDKELDPLYEDYHRLNEKLKRPQLEELQKVMFLLKKFYKNRQIDEYDQVLTLQGNKLVSNGAQFQSIIPIDERNRKLVLYQNEMKSFTEFIKKMYLSGI